MHERDSTPSQEPRFFSDTLSAGRDRVPLHYRVSAPLGLTAHGFAIAAITIVSMLALPEQEAPSQPSPTLLQFSPPPAPTLMRGAADESSPARIVDADIDTLDPPSFEIPDTMLTTTVALSDVSSGLDHGFDDGLASGMPGGVLGGVPGGLVGGLIGGTGNRLPEFPKADVGARPIQMPPPTYTEEAIRASVRGSVKLRVIITEQGKIEVIEVLRSIPELDAAAIRAVESTWLFEPATRSGRPVPSLGDLVVRFNLH